MLTAIETNDHYDSTDALRLIQGACDSALARGRPLTREAADAALAKSLQGSAGRAHRAANVDNALPPLLLVMTEGKGADKKLITDPRKVAEAHAKPWKKVWGDDSQTFKEITC